MDFDLATPLPATGSVDIDDQLALARAAEDAGYGTLFLAETWGREVFTRLGWLAAHLDDIRLGTGIIPVHSRSPALIGQAAATLDELTDGNAVLGLGLSSPYVMRNWHGAEWEPALRRQRETVEVVRQVLSGEEVDYDGDVFDLEGFHLRFDPVRSDLPVYIAAQGPTNCELTGGFADGWLPNRIPVSALPEVREHVDRGAEKQDRDPEDVATMPYVATCILEDGDQARHRVREFVAFYVGAMGDYHFNAVADHGFRETAEAIRDNWQAGDHDASREAVSADLLSEIAITGTPEEAAESMAQYEDVAETVVTLPPTTATREEIIETMEHAGRLASE